MILFKCNSSECPFAPCFLRCDKAVGGESISKPLACPHEYTEPTWKAMPYTRVSANTCDELEDWLYNNSGEIPNHIMEVIEGLFPFDSVLGQSASKLAQAMGLLRDYGASYHDREDILVEIKKMNKIQILAAAFQSSFRAGIIYDEMMRAGDARFTQNDD